MQKGIKRRKQAQEEASEDEAGEAKGKGGEAAGAEAGQAEEIEKEAEAAGEVEENQGEDEEQAAAAEEGSCIKKLLVRERHRFFSKFFSKSNDFDRPAWPGVAGIEKVSIFIKIPLKK